MPYEPAEPRKPPSQLDRANQRIQMLLRSPATVAISVANVIVFAIAEHAGDTTQTDTLLRFGASERSLIWSGEYWRFVTPMFLHIGLLHLVWNTYAGFSWCSLVERALGWRQFLFIYLASGIAATAASVIGHDVVSAGASGAMFGIVGVTLVLMYRAAGSFSAFLKHRAVPSTLVSIGVWFAIGMTALAMDNYAHVGGLIAGIGLGLLFTRPVETGRQRLFRYALALAALAIIVFAASRPLPFLHGTDRPLAAADKAWKPRRPGPPRPHEHPSAAAATH